MTHYETLRDSWVSIFKTYSRVIDERNFARSRLRLAIYEIFESQKQR